MKFIYVVLFFSLFSFRSLGQFTNVAATTVTNNSNAKDGGVAWADLNNDGCLDLIFNTNNRSHVLFSDCNLPNPTFTDVTGTKIKGFNNSKCERSISAGDYNNDGYIDLCRNTSGRLEVYLNNGAPNYTFGIGTGQTPNFYKTAIPNGMNVEGFGWMDYNNNGWLDLIIENHGYGIDIYENPTDGTSNFTHVTPNGSSKGLPEGGNVGDYMTLGDYNGDGFVDILARKSNSTRDLWENQGNGTFAANINFPIQNVSNGNKGGVLFCDFDNDGDFDIFWTEFGTNQIFEQTGLNSGNFTALNEPAISSGVTPVNTIDGCSCGDVDNDGDLDLFLGSNSGSSYLYLNNGSMNFSRNNLGINVNGNSEGNSFGDYDNDGDLDLYINVSGANQLWRNGLNNNNYLKIHVKRDLGGGIFRDDLGATAVLKDCNGIVLGGIRQVSSVKGHGANNPAIIHFGLPAGNTHPYLVEVRFTSVGGTRLITDTVVIPSTVANQTITMISPSPVNSGFNACSAYLPIELMHFNATLNKNGIVDLSWTTLSELNNDFFTIERSADGSSWDEVVNVDGVGHNNRELVYLEKDFYPLYSTSYYRLKQTDFDGTYTYSKLVKIKNNKVNGLSIYPNPTTATISILGTEEELSVLTIYNMQGKQVSGKVVTVEKGKNKIILDIESLPNGVYLFKTLSEVRKIHKK